MARQAIGRTCHIEGIVLSCSGPVRVSCNVRTGTGDTLGRQPPQQEASWKLKGCHIQFSHLLREVELFSSAAPFSSTVRQSVVARSHFLSHLLLEMTTLIGSCSAPSLWWKQKEGHSLALRDVASSVGQPLHRWAYLWLSRCSAPSAGDLGLAPNPCTSFATFLLQLACTRHVHDLGLAGVAILERLLAARP
ncbi:hypothetical protein FKM82_024792 [Ascaphus truei]